MRSRGLRADCVNADAAVLPKGASALNLLYSHKSTTQGGAVNVFPRRGLGWLGRLGHRIADFDPQSGISGAVMRFCWRVGYKSTPKAK